MIRILPLCIVKQILRILVTINPWCLRWNRRDQSFSKTEPCTSHTLSLFKGKGVAQLTRSLFASESYASQWTFFDVGCLHALKK